MTTTMLISAQLQNTRRLSNNPSDTSIHENLQPSLQPEEDIPVLLEDSICVPMRWLVSYLVGQNNSSLLVTPCIGLIGFQSVTLDPSMFQVINYKVKSIGENYKSKALQDFDKCINTHVENVCVNIFLRC